VAAQRRRARLEHFRPRLQAQVAGAGEVQPRAAVDRRFGGRRRFEQPARPIRRVVVGGHSQDSP
jgi:hypothetical protein